MTEAINRRAIRVSAIIATYNRAQYLGQALDSLLAQTRAPDEILVVNDGSTDDTEAVLRSYGEAIKYVNRPNGGKPAALNAAIPIADGTHLWLFDDDDIALPHALEAHVDFLTRCPEIDFSFSRNYTFDGDGDIWNESRWRTPPFIDLTGENLLSELLKHCDLVFQALLVPKHCFEAVGYFNEAIGRSEDYDILIRLARRFRGGNIHDTTFVWRNHGGERGAAHERHSNAARAELFRKYEREIFARVWRELELVEYLPLDDPDRAAATNGRASRLELRALARRSDVMFQHDLPRQGADDIRRILATADLPQPIVAAVQQTLTQAADVGDPVFVKTAHDRMRHLERAIQGPYRRLLSVDISRGCYWAIRRAMRQRRFGDALTLARAALAFGARGVVAIPRRAMKA